MDTVDASIVFLPRFTTLVASGSTSFATAPLDVSSFTGAQFQVWRGTVLGGSGEEFQLYLEESLDGISWVLGPSTPAAITIPANDPRFFSYSFRLRWFRLRAVVTGSLVTCWAEGLLRGGGSGAWPVASGSGAAMVDRFGNALGGPPAAMPASGHPGPGSSSVARPALRPSAPDPRDKMGGRTAWLLPSATMDTSSELIHDDGWIGGEMTMVLRLMPDYHCFPLWWEVDRIGNVDPRDLPLTPGLTSALLAWAQEYDETLNQEDPAASGFRSEAEEAAFDIEGRRLWQWLRRELAGHYNIVYFSTKDSRLYK